MNSLATSRSMSSIEIALLTDKRHDNVKRDIETMLEELELDTLSFEEVSFNSQNQRVNTYNLNEELTLTLVSGYNTKMRSAIIKRWRELEDNAPLSLEDMTLLVVEGQKEKILQLERKIEDDKSVTEFGKAISQSVGTCKIGDWIKAINEQGDISIGRNKAFDLLRRKGYLGKDNMPYQSKIEQGLFQVKEGMVVTDLKTIQTFTPLLTGKGQMFLAAKIKEWLL